MKGTQILSNMLAITTFAASGGNQLSFAGFVAEGVDSFTYAQAADLSILMDHLDAHYTPHCLRVLMIFRGTKEDMNSTDKISIPKALNKKLYHPSEDVIAKITTNDKPYMIIFASGKNFEHAKSAVNIINKNPGRVAPFACVSYLLSGPPDARLLPILTDPTSSKRLTRYFLVHTQNSTEAEQFLLDQRLGKEENVAALVQEESQNKSYWRVLIRQLLHPSGSPQVLTVNRWSRDTGLTSTENIFPEQMANFYGKKLTGITMEFVPFAYYEQFEGTLVVKFKPCITLLIVNAIADHLNFTYEIVLPPDGVWGYLDETGHFVGMLGEIEFGHGDFAFDLVLTLERAQLIDFTRMYYQDSLTFITAKSPLSPPWRKILTPFRTLVWLCVLVSVGGGSLLYHVIYHAQATLTSSRLLSSHAFMQVLASFLNQSLHSCLSLQAGRVFLGFWFLYAFLVTSYYKTSLTSTLAVPFAPPTIDTLQELSQSGLSFGMRAAKGAEYTLFSTSDSKLFQEMFKAMTFHTTADNMKKVSEERYSYIYFRSTLDMLVAMHNNDPKRKTDIIVAKEEFFAIGYACAFPRGSPYLKYFDTVMKKLMWGGLINKWAADMYDYYGKKQQDDNGGSGQASEEQSSVAKQTSSVVVLNLNHLQGPFFMMFLGVAGGALVLLVELLTYRGFDNCCIN